MKYDEKGSSCERTVNNKFNNIPKNYSTFMYSLITKQLGNVKRLNMREKRYQKCHVMSPQHVLPIFNAFSTNTITYF